MPTGKAKPVGTIQIIGAEVRFEAPIVNCSALQGELVLAKMDETLETVESAFSMSYAYDLLSHSDTTIAGTELKTFEPYGDQLEEVPFDWFALGAAVIGTIVAVVVVALLTLTGIGAFVVGGIIAGAIVGGALAGRAAYNSGARGFDLAMAILEGADTGAQIGMIGGLVSFAVFAAGASLAGAAGLGLGGTMLCGGSSGFIMSVGTQLAYTHEVDWEKAFKDGFISAAFAGVFYGFNKAYANFKYNNRTGEFRDVKNLDDFQSRVPKNAERLPWKSVEGGAKDGIKFRWNDSDGNLWNVRAHSVDPSAPSGSNASKGWIYRVEVRWGGAGKTYYMDSSGQFHPYNVTYPNSPMYNEVAANNTHIPLNILNIPFIPGYISLPVDLPHTNE